jgi:hypothetical protein
MRHDFSTFPGGHGEEFRALDGEVCSLCQRWLLFMHLFHDDERIDLLRESCEDFCAELQAIWSQYVVVQIFRVADENVDGGRLSLATLMEVLRAEKHEAIADFEKLYQTVRDKCKLLIPMRHNLLAHINRNIATGKKSFKLPLNGEIRAAIDAIKAFMHKCWIEIFNVDPSYGHQIMKQDANALLVCLARGAEYFQLQLEEPQVYGPRLHEHGKYANLLCKIGKRS